MPGFQHFTSPLDAARFLVRENRLHELSFDDLSLAERDVVIADLRSELSRVRRRALRAHLMGAAHTALFLALGATFLSIGPAGLRGAFDRSLGRTTAPEEVFFWAFQVLLASLGALTVDYLLRRRLRIARMWDHESRSFRDALRRAEAWLPAGSDSSSSGSDGSSAVADRGPVRDALAVLRKHAHERSTHYLIERLSGADRGEPLTAETWEALRSASRHLREEYGAHTEADALQRWIEMQEPRKA